MKKPSPQLVVYFLGLLPFALFYYRLKAAIGSDLLFVAAALAYLGALVVIGHLVARFIDSRRGS